MFCEKQDHSCGASCVSLLKWNAEIEAEHDKTNLVEVCFCVFLGFFSSVFDILCSPVHFGLSCPDFSGPIAALWLPCP